MPSRPTPERISQESSSLRGVVMRDWPGRRRSSSNWSSSRVSWSFGGTPSTTQPTPPPWDSPNVVTRNMRPKELPMARTPGTRGRGGRNGQRRRVEGVGLEFIPRFRAGWLRTCAGTGCAIGARGARGSEFDGIERLPAHPVERVGLGRARRLTHSAARGRDLARRDADCGGATIVPPRAEGGDGGGRDGDARDGGDGHRDGKVCR